jgi:hypothetical protein
LLQPAEPRYLRTAQVAELLQVSPKTVSRWAQEGMLPYFRTLASIPGAGIELRCRSERESRMEPLAASPRFRPLTCEKSSAGDYDGMRSPALPHGVGRHSIRCSRRAELREPLAVQRGGTWPADRGIRNRLSDWPGLVHVDQLRRQTLRTTTSLVRRRFNSFAAPGRFRQGGLPGIEVSGLGQKRVGRSLLFKPHPARVHPRRLFLPSRMPL